MSSRSQTCCAMRPFRVSPAFGIFVAISLVWQSDAQAADRKASAAAQGNAGPLVIAQDGKTDFAIIAAKNAVEAESAAARELAEYLGKATGATFPIVTEGTANKATHNIHVGWTDFASRCVGDVHKLADEEWIIRTVGQDLILAGGRPRGTLYAVYEFLEQQVGCHWFDEFTEVIPSQPSLTIKELDIRGRPAFRDRQIFTDIEATTNDSNRLSLFRRRNKDTGSPVYWLGRCYGSPGPSHTFYSYAKDWPADHPEYLAMTESGERPVAKNSSGPGQICLTNPEVRKLMLRQLKSFIAADRKATVTAGCKPPWIYVVEPNDAQWICQCPECKTFSKREGADSAPLVDLINFLADGIKTEYPEVLVETFAYANTLQPPKTVRPRDNVMIRIAQLNAEWAPKDTMDDYPDLFRPMTHAVNRKPCQTLVGWSKIAKHLSYWDYWILYVQRDEGYPKTDLFQTPYVTLNHIKSDLKLLFDNNVEVMFVECEEPETSSFFAMKRWVGLKLMQDPRQPAEPLIETFMAGYYGQASRKMNDYLKYMERRIAAVRGTEKLSAMREHTRPYLDFNFFATCTRFLDEAESLCGSDNTALLNVRRERIPVDCGLLGMWTQLQKQVPKGRSMPWDREKVFKRYETVRLAQMEVRRSKDKLQQGKELLQKDLKKLRAMPLSE